MTFDLGAAMEMPIVRNAGAFDRVMGRIYPISANSPSAPFLCELIFSDVAPQVIAFALEIGSPPSSCRYLTQKSSVDSHLYVVTTKFDVVITTQHEDAPPP